MYSITLLYDYYIMLEAMLTLCVYVNNYVINNYEYLMIEVE